ARPRWQDQAATVASDVQARPELTGDRLHKMAGMGEQQMDPTTRRVCSRCSRLVVDAHLCKAVESVSARFDVDVQRDHARLLACGDGDESPWPALPPGFDARRLGGRVATTVLSKWPLVD